MLNLTLKEGDYLMIGDDIRVVFLEDMPAKCIRIGIEAPKSISIARNKPYEKALAENIEKNALKLEEIELQKQAQIIAKQQTKEKRRVKAMEKRERKATLNSEAMEA